MKKSIIFALLLSLLSVQQIHAQKWLKKLGKVAENVLANDQKTINKASGSIPGCTVKYTSCVANGNDVHINFVITNTTSSDVHILFNFYDDGSCAFDSKNAKHKTHFYIGGKKLDHYNSYALPSNVPVKGIMVIEDVDRTIKQLNSTIIKGKANDMEFALSLPTQVIADTKNTNSDYVTCSLPELQFNFLKCVRQGKNVVITATFKNNSNKEYSVCSGNKNATVYDNEGESYEFDRDASFLGKNRWISYDGITLLCGVPMKATFVIPNVSTSATDFSVIKIPFTYYYNDNSTEQFIEFRNLPISAQ